MPGGASGAVLDDMLDGALLERHATYRLGLDYTSSRRRAFAARSRRSTMLLLAAG